MESKKRQNLDIFFVRAQCEEYNDLLGVLHACYDKVLPAINERHPWDFEFLD